MTDVFQFVVPIRHFPRSQRRYRHDNLNIQGLTDAELRMRYRFGRDAIHCITNLLCDDLIRDTDRNFPLSPTCKSSSRDGFSQTVASYRFLEKPLVLTSPLCRELYGMYIWRFQGHETCLFVGH